MGYDGRFRASDGMLGLLTVFHGLVTVCRVSDDNYRVFDNIYLGLR